MFAFPRRVHTVKLDPLAMVHSRVFAQEIIEVVVWVGNGADFVLSVDKIAVQSSVRINTRSGSRRESGQLTQAPLIQTESVPREEDRTSYGETSLVLMFVV